MAWRKQGKNIAYVFKKTGNRWIVIADNPVLPGGGGGGKKISYMYLRNR
jgi:hypothetical protein